MLTIICGEDTVTSRDYFVSLQSDYRNKGFMVRRISGDEFLDINKGLFDAQSLFSDKIIFVGERLSRFIKMFGKKGVGELKKVADNDRVELIDWEDTSLYELRMGKDARFKEFKPKETIFSLQEALFPTNRTRFITLLEIVSQSQDPGFIYIMICRHARHLLLAKEHVLPQKMPFWQSKKLESQSKFWDKDKLIQFYEGLLRIDIGQKTSTTPFSLTNALAILAYHFL